MATSNKGWTLIRLDISKKRCASRLILGQSLFIAYINDLPDRIVSTCNIYSKDKKILTQIRRINLTQDIMQFQRDIHTVLANTA